MSWLPLPFFDQNKKVTFFRNAVPNLIAFFISIPTKFDADTITSNIIRCSVIKFQFGWIEYARTQSKAPCVEWCWTHYYLRYFSTIYRIIYFFTSQYEKPRKWKKWVFLRIFWLPQRHLSLHRNHDFHFFYFFLIETDKKNEWRKQ